MAGTYQMSALSIALVTRNRPASLRRCLASLRAQDAPVWEVVVADDSDAEHAEQTRAVAAEFSAQVITGPKRGLYANRNAAARACTGTHIRTMDDDHTLPPGHIAQCLAAIAHDPRVIWTCGERSILNGQPFDFTATAAQLHPSGVACAVSDVDDNWAIADGATIYPQEIFQRGFRFIENFTYGSSYLEFGALLYSRGWRGRCIAGAHIEHHADSATLTRRASPSGLYASLCYNLHFRPNLLKASRYALPYLLRDPRLLFRLPAILQRAKTRWAALPSSSP